jgi:competence protein CoiA
MKFALHNEERKKAIPDLKGALCPVCKADVIAKCGDKNIHHWAHKSKKKCDHWWENETQWHRDWKNQFSEDWQEIVQKSETGEKHIADLKTPNGLVVEFQHSPIRPEEIRARNDFYKNIIWIVDGKRRKTDEKKFEEALEWRGWNSSRLLKDWTIFSKPVFFDFGKSLLWGVFDGFPIKLEKKNFIICVNDGSIKRKINDLVNLEIRKINRERRSVNRGKSVWGSVMKRGY